MKRLIPQRIHWAWRRAQAKKKQARVRDRPIHEATGKAPPAWPGWPEGRKFALVLTHDVESSVGLANVRRLAEIEMEEGFRSSFNFIPEGRYRVPPDLVDWLREQGFEVGVHDFRHDGRLMQSRKSFRRRAECIRDYARAWGARGFRAARPVHNRLQWLQELDLDYDASTFDVDPFGRQSAAAYTIFPFWVPSLQNPEAGYLELPATLPQDTTLFLLLREQSIDIWKRKIRWLRDKGGMALVNVHPDYMDFEGDGHPGQSYPACRYQEFLQHLKAHFRSEFWSALPKEVAAYCKGFKPALAGRRPKRVCMLAYSDYETDGRIIRYAQTLQRAGDVVDVIGCASSESEMGVKDVDGVRLANLQYRRDKQTKGVLSHLFPLLSFAFRASIVLARNHLSRRYDLIHVHNIPEWLVFAAAFPRLLGARVILDLHDLVPELYETKFRQRAGTRVIVPLLRATERICCRFADHVIISNHLWRDTVVKRSVPPNECSVFINNIDPLLFRKRARKREDGRKIIIFPGTLQWHQGVDIAIRAFPRVLNQVPNAEFHIYGGGGVKDDLVQLVRDLGLSEKILFRAPVGIKEIPQLIADSDLGVVPKRADSFGNQAYSTKIMEFMSQGVPVVISRTAIDSFYFNNSQVQFCESGNVEEFARAMIELLTNQKVREQFIENSLEYVAKNHWGSRMGDYLDLVDRLIRGGRRQPPLRYQREKFKLLDGCDEVNRQFFLK